MIGDELAKDLDALIAEAKAQPPVTAPTPERRVGEERLVPLAEMDFGVFYQVLDDARKADATLIRDLALDLLDERAANARLTAEVERLTKEKAEAVEIARHAVNRLDKQPHRYVEINPATGLFDDVVDVYRARLAALSLPTPAPEATE